MLIPIFVFRVSLRSIVTNECIELLVLPRGLTFSHTAFTSSVAVFLNKIVITNYKFNFPFFYIGAQVFCTLIILLIGRMLRLFAPKTLTRGELLHVRTHDH